MENYWKNLTLAQFWSRYDIVYGKDNPDKNDLRKYIPLENKKGFIKRRSTPCVLRYYVNYANDEDIARGLLILFFPFKNEMLDIHQQDGIKLYDENKDD